MSRRDSRRESDNADANQLHSFVYDHLVALWRTAEINALVLKLPVEEAEAIVTDAIGQFFVDRLYGQDADLRDVRDRIEDFWEIAEESDQERGRGERDAREPEGREDRPDRE